MLQPLVIAELLKYFNGTIELWEGLVYAAMISILAFINSIAHHPFYLNTYGYGMKIRLGFSGLIYKKVTYENKLKRYF